MAHLIKETFTYLKYNALTLALFELIHKLLLLAVIVPSFFSILTTIMQKLNMTYLSAKQAVHFCLSPSVLILGFFYDYLSWICIIFRSLRYSPPFTSSYSSSKTFAFSNHYTKPKRGVKYSSPSKPFTPPFSNEYHPYLFLFI